MKNLIKGILVLNMLAVMFLFSFEKAEATTSVNLAQNASCTASGNYSDYYSEHATDNDFDSSWYADPSDNQANISVDLGNVCDFNQLVVYWGIYDYSEDFVIMVSDSVSPGEDDWTILSPTNISTNITQAHHITTINFAPTSQRHIRIMCNTRVDWSFEIFEIQAYNTSAASTPVPGTTATPAPTVTSTPIPGSTPTPVPEVTATPEPQATDVPDEITELTATVVSKTYCKLAWAPVEDATRYIIYRDGSNIATSTEVNFTNYGIFENRTYSYIVEAVDSSGDVIQSESLTLTTMAGTSEKLHVEAYGDNYISIGWTNPTANAVKIYRNNALIYTQSISGEETQVFTDTNLQSGTDYTYRLVGINSLGEESSYSVEFTASTSNLESEDLILKVNKTTNNKISVSWNPIANCTGYQIFRSSSSDDLWELIYTGTNISYVDESVTQSNSYLYYCKAIIPGGYVDSNSVSAVAESPNTDNCAYLPLEWFDNRTFGNTDINSFINARLDELEAASIKYLFCDIGCFEYYDSTLTNTINYSALARWMHFAQPRGMKVVICINHANYEDTTTIENRIINKTKNICTNIIINGLLYNNERYYADGVSIDFEPFNSNTSRNFILRLLTNLRTTLGSDTFISVALPAKNGLYSNAEAIRIIEKVDMINPMIYDSNEPYYDTDYTTPGELAAGTTRKKDEYINLVSETCIWYSNLIAQSNNTDCILSPTLPVYEDKIARAGEYGGFPDSSSSIYMYHCNYNYIREESLETLENALTGVAMAKAAGATVNSCGIFYWGCMAGLCPRQYSQSVSSYYNPEHDRDIWNDMWVNNPN